MHSSKEFNIFTSVFSRGNWVPRGQSLCKSGRPSSLPAGVQQAYLQSFYFKTLSVSKSQTIRNRLLNVFLLSIVLNLISKNRMCSG